MTMIFKNGTEAIAFATNTSKYTIGVIFRSDYLPSEGVSYCLCIRDVANRNWIYEYFMNAHLRNVIRQSKLRYKVVGTFKTSDRQWDHYNRRWIIER